MESRVSKEGQVYGWIEFLARSLTMFDSYQCLENWHKFLDNLYCKRC